jgi:hypothetical protein
MGKGDRHSRQPARRREISASERIESAGSGLNPLRIAATASLASRAMRMIGNYRKRHVLVG